MHANPVVILAAPHSEAARVAAMLGRHPRAYHLPELRLFYCDSIGELLSLFEHTGERVADGLLRALAQIFFGGQTDAGITGAQRYLRRRADWSTAALFHAICEAVAPRVPVLHDCCAPMRVTELDRWFDAAPQARFIHLVRHPLGFSQAANEQLSTRVYYPPDYADSYDGHHRLDPQLLWYRVNDTLTRELNAREDSHEYQLVLETLLRDAPAELSSLCAWLQWEANSNTTELMLHPEQSAFSVPGPLSAPKGIDSTFLESPEFSAPLSLGATISHLQYAGFAQEVISAASAYGYRQ